MKAKKTQNLTWVCPDCKLENNIFFIEGEILPDVIECSFCNHVSPELEWEWKIPSDRQYEENKNK